MTPQTGEATRSGDVATGEGIAIRGACWLGHQVLLLDFAIEAVRDAPIKLLARSGRRSIPTEMVSFVYQHGQSATGDSQIDALVVGAFNGHVPCRAPGRTLEIRLGTLKRVLTHEDVAEAGSDVRTLARTRLAALEPGIRANLLEMVSGRCAEALKGEARVTLARGLFQLREILREHRPYCIVSREEPQGLKVDSILAVDDRSVWVKGWARDRDAAIAELRLISPEGTVVGLLPGAHRFSRPDVDEFYDGWVDRRERSGFMAFAELCAPSVLDLGWVAEMENTLGAGTEVNAPAVLRNPATIRDSILTDLAGEKPIGGDLTVGHAHPALSRLQERLQREVGIDTVVEHGRPPGEPLATVVVPLHGRIDFVEHQLAQFVHDPELHLADLIYVLDSPELGDQLEDLAAQIHPLYRQPFRVATLTRNAGFSLANNLGATLARGEHLLFLNSDVIPERTGWLGQMLEFYGRTPKIGALGVKLLYEDGSLQHAGLYFEQSPGSDVWENAPFFQRSPPRLSTGQLDSPRAGRDRRLPDDRQGICSKRSAASEACTSRATARIRISACDSAKQAVRTGTCRPPNSSILRPSRTPLSSGS